MQGDKPGRGKGGGRREGKGVEGEGDAPSLDGAGQVDAESVCAESHKGSPLKQKSSRTLLPQGQRVCP